MSHSLRPRWALLPCLIVFALASAQEVSDEYDLGEIVVIGARPDGLSSVGGSGGSVRVYIACSGDGLTPCYEGRPWTVDEIRAAAPDALVVFDAARVRSRPPSVNRLPGLVWLAYVLPARELYHVDLGADQIRDLAAR